MRTSASWSLVDTWETRSSPFCTKFQNDNHVFHTQVKYWIGSKRCRPHIVTIDRRCLWNRYTKFRENRLYPNYFRGCKSNSPIFSLSWSSNWFLILWWPRYSIVSKKDNMGASWWSVIWISSPAASEKAWRWSGEFLRKNSPCIIPAKYWSSR